MSKAATAELQAQMLSALQALAPATDAAAIVPSDTLDLAQEAVGIACGGNAGAVKLRTAAGNDRTIAIAAGQTIALRFRRVFLTGTSATGLTALMNAAALAITPAPTPSPTPTPAPSLSLSSAVIKAEGNSGTTALTWTLTLNRDGSTANYPYAWAVTGNGSNPANAADFGGTLPSGSGAFAPGETTKTITVQVSGDTAVEPDETFMLTVTASGLNTVTSTGTISNDDASQPTLSLSSAVTQAEGNAGTSALTWTLTLNRDGSTASYPYAWAVTGTGANPADAADFGGTLPSGNGTFAPGETAKTITVQVSGDTAFEPTEAFTLTVTASGLNTVTSTGTISNDDLPPLVLTPANATIPASAAPGYQLFAITGVPAGATPTVAPNDGRFVVGGNAGSGWVVMLGSSAISAGSVNLTVSAAGALDATFALTVSSRITPTNWDVLGYGDSRTDTALAGTLTGSAGYTAGTSNFGPIGWAQVLSGNRLRFGRYPNFGISASTTTQGAAVPRLNASSVETNSTPQTWFRGTDSRNKGADYAAAHPAGIVVILYGVNDADNLLSSTSRTNLLAILNNLRPGQLKVLFNETGTGKKIDGSIAGGTTANKLAFADWIKTLDADSGHANARNDVLVVDSMAPSYDAAAGTNYLGWLRDDRHPTPWGSRKWGQLMIDRLAAAYGSVWTNLPKRITLPTAAGAPFIHSNPLLTPGGNGQVVGTNFGTAPTAATIPQGFAVAGSGTGAGITVVCDKTGTTPDGFPMFQVSVSGTLADQSNYTLQIYQLASGSAVALTDKLQGVCKRRILPGSQQLAGARLRISVTDATVAKSQGAYDQGGSFGGSGDRLGYYINSAGFDAGGAWEELQTQIIDLADPNMDTANGGPGVIASPSQVAVYMELQFGNYTGATANVSATVQLAQMGMLKV